MDGRQNLLGCDPLRFAAPLRADHGQRGGGHPDLTSLAQAAFGPPELGRITYRRGRAQGNAHGPGIRRDLTKNREWGEPRGLRASGDWIILFFFWGGVEERGGWRRGGGGACPQSI